MGAPIALTRRALSFTLQDLKATVGFDAVRQGSLAWQNAGECGRPDIDACTS